MNGIDTAVASLLASRIDSLLPIGARSGATTSETDASLNVRQPPGAPIAMMPAPLPASAQTVLSAVALTLDAITRSGGDRAGRADSCLARRARHRHRASAVVRHGRERIAGRGFR